MEYKLVMYDTLAEFNAKQDKHASQGWRIKDYRLVRSPDARFEHGVVILWQKGL